MFFLNVWDSDRLEGSKRKNNTKTAFHEGSMQDSLAYFFRPSVHFFGDYRAEPQACMSMQGAPTSACSEVGAA